MASAHPKFFSVKWKVKLLLYVHALLFFFRKTPSPFQSEKINNILICNWATLGDVLLSTSVLSAIKEKWPHAKIGFLTSPTSKIAIKDHPLIDKIHTAPNWKQKAHNHSSFVQLLLFFHSLLFKYTSLIQELHKEHYDLGIDLHPFFPNTGFILKKAKIPYILGFSSAGWHPSSSHNVKFPEKLAYLPHMYTHLLRPIGIETNNLKPCFHYKHTSLLQENYIIFHVGTTCKKKEWPTAYWKILSKKLSSEGFKIVFTGKGKREEEMITDIASLCPGSINLCNKLDWDQFVSVIKEGQVLISVDTAAVHLAAALETPVLALYLATKYLELWLPETRSCHFLLQETFPLYLSDPLFLKNNHKIRLVHEILPSDVYDSFKQV